jgi:hypothetical protein
MTPEEFTKEVITDTTFANLADVIIERDGIIKPEHIATMKAGNCVVFCQTDSLQKVFDTMQVLGLDCKKYILITHRSDFTIDESRYNTKHPAVVKWYAANANILRPDLVPIPLGMESPGCMGYSDHPEVLEKVLKEPREIKNLVYMNFSRTTQPKRQLWVDYFQGKPWVTEKSKTPFEKFIRDCYGHSFVLSPEGNGIDTHRTWEALYMGAIPIVQRSVFIDSFRFSPLIVVDDITAITKEYLENIAKDYMIGSYAETEIKMSYWKSRIDKDRKELLCVG